MSSGERTGLIYTGEGPSVQFSLENFVPYLVEKKLLLGLHAHLTCTKVSFDSGYELQNGLRPKLRMMCLCR